MKSLFTISTCLSILLSFPMTAVAQRSPVDLGTLGGTTSLAWAISSNGHIVGESQIAGNTATHPFAWTSATGMVDLGTLGGSYAVAAAVNGKGQAVGWSFVVGDAEVHGFSWTATGGLIDLGTLGGTFSVAKAVNDNGRVVGSSSLADGSSHAFLWTATTGMVDLGTLGGSTSAANDVNSKGQIVGGSSLADGSHHAFIWTPGVGMLDLGTLGGTFSTAVAVNDQGQVVGTSQIAGNTAQHAFSWTPTGGMVDLGTLGGTQSFVATGPPDPEVGLLNERGQVAGGSSTDGDTEHHGFLWTPGHSMVDLGTLGGQYSFPAAVNDAGQVVGSSYPGLSFPPLRAFLWTEESGMADLGTLGGTNSSAVAINSRGQVVGSSNVVGDAASHATLWNTAPDDPFTLLSQLIDQVRDLRLRRRGETLLLATLSIARATLGDHNRHNDVAARAALNAFIHVVRKTPLVDINGQPLEPATRAALIDAARTIVDLVARG